MMTTVVSISLSSNDSSADELGPVQPSVESDDSDSDESEIQAKDTATFSLSCLITQQLLINPPMRTGKTVQPGVILLSPPRQTVNYQQMAKD